MANHQAGIALSWIVEIPDVRVVCIISRYSYFVVLTDSTMINRLHKSNDSRSANFQVPAWVGSGIYLSDKLNSAFFMCYKLKYIRFRKCKSIFV